MVIFFVRRLLLFVIGSVILIAGATFYGATFNRVGTLVVRDYNSFENQPTTYFDPITYISINFTETGYFDQPDIVQDSQHRFEYEDGVFTIFYKRNRWSAEQVVKRVTFAGEHIVFDWRGDSDDRLSVVIWNRDTLTIDVHQVDMRTGDTSYIGTFPYEESPSGSIHFTKDVLYIPHHESDYFGLVNLATGDYFEAQYHRLQSWASEAFPFFVYSLDPASVERNEPSYFVFSLQTFERTAIALSDSEQDIQFISPFMGESGQLQILIVDYNQFVWLYDAETDRYERFPDAYRLSRWSNAWSSDASMLAMIQLNEDEGFDYGIYHMEDARFQRLLSSEETFYFNSSSYYRMEWSPDLEHLLFYQFDQTDYGDYLIYDVATSALVTSGDVPAQGFSSYFGWHFPSP